MGNTESPNDLLTWNLAHKIDHFLSYKILETKIIGHKTYKDTTFP